MKRSQINNEIRRAMEMLDQAKIKLPPFGYWKKEQWESGVDDLSMIRKTMLGWDITDFGSDDFKHIGAVLFTLRNGCADGTGCGTPYAQKYIIVKEGQFLPTHYHAVKTEDIINLSSGVMSVFLYNTKPDGSVDTESDVSLFSDGIRKTMKAGEELLVKTGASITLTPYIYHRFGAKLGLGDLICGEVSSVNDDKTDNYFAEDRPRFSRIVEDEPAIWPLCSDEL